MEFQMCLMILGTMLVCVALLVTGIVMLPWCKDSKNSGEKDDYIASWSSMGVHHDTSSVSPLPPYFFVNGVIGYDKIATFV